MSIPKKQLLHNLICSSWIDHLLMHYKEVFQRTWLVKVLNSVYKTHIPQLFALTFPECSSCKPYHVKGLSHYADPLFI
jgi:hypothetical protein